VGKTDSGFRLRYECSRSAEALQESAGGYSISFSIAYPIPTPRGEFDEGPGQLPGWYDSVKMVCWMHGPEENSFISNVGPSQRRLRSRYTGRTH